MSYKLVSMDAVSEIKGRLNIEDVVAEYIQLKRAGSNYKGKSPWTNEKTPSFMVSPEKQIWHDFSSGKGGDIFGFVMEMEGLDFKGALEQLARKAGVELEQFQGRSNQVNTQRKNRTLEILELAAKFYQKQLTANNTALEYLIKKRGFSKKTILEWQLGYSPNTHAALTTFLTKRGYTVDDMKQTGLVVQRQSGTGDMFRGRIMIPLCDGRGAVVGFTARLLRDQPDAPKYINTPQTVVYDKSRQVYGLHMARESIRKNGFVVVAEGNLDVISSHQAGIANVVASAGTAMTEMHLRELKRFTSDIRLSFDADRAGIAATERVIPLAQKAGVALRIINIVGAKDPDELVRKGVKLWQEAIEGSQDAPDWLIDRYKEELDLKTAPGKRAFTDALLPTIRSLSDGVEREHYLKQIAELTDTSFETLQSKLTSTKSVEKTLRRKISQNEPSNSAVMEYQKLQDHFLAMALSQTKLRDLLKKCQEQFFTDGPSRQLYNFLKQNPEIKNDTSLSAKLPNIIDYVKICSLQFEELYADLDYSDLREQAENLKHRLIDRYVTNQKHLLANAMGQTENEKELAKLTSQADKLNKLIK